MRPSIPTAITLLLAAAWLTAPAFGATVLTTTPAADAGAQQYTCPMHPEIVKDEPGTCPICKMKLVPVKKQKSHEH